MTGNFCIIELNPLNIIMNDCQKIGELSTVVKKI